jgi:hypothetical protein
MEIPIKQSEPQGGRDIDGGWDGTVTAAGEIESGKVVKSSEGDLPA